jgi:transcriptional regulator with XRE-family HTH domain
MRREPTMRERRANDHGQRWGDAVLRRRREALGLTREALARATRVAASTIRNLERGRVARPEPMTLRLLCGALSLPMPGDEGLYLSLDGVPADDLRRVVAAALHELARRRRDAERFARMIHLPSDATRLRLATASVAAERDLACDLVGLLCPDRDRTELSASPQRPPDPGELSCLRPPGIASPDTL